MRYIIQRLQGSYWEDTLLKDNSLEESRKLYDDVYYKMISLYRSKEITKLVEYRIFDSKTSETVYQKKS